MSHIITAEPKFTDLDLLRDKVEEAGCFWIGARDSIKVFNSTLKGTAFHIPDMQYPVVINNEGEMVYEMDCSISSPRVGPYKILMEIMRNYVADQIRRNAHHIVRSWRDEIGIVHIDIKKGNTLLKFNVGLGGEIKATTEEIRKEVNAE